MLSHACECRACAHVGSRMCINVLGDGIALAIQATTIDKIGDVDDGGWEEGGGSDGS